MLLGMARKIKNELGVPVVCSLQDENEWIDPMREEYRDLVWDKMAEKAKDIDAFIAASQFYSKKSQQKLHIPTDKIYVIYGGIDLNNYEQALLTCQPPVIGYLCRMSEYFGLGIIVDAFIKLKKDPKYTDLKLSIMGGYTGDDKPFIKKMIKKLSAEGVFNHVTMYKQFDITHRLEFLKSLSLLSVPVIEGEAFGAYQIEALASGVPIVQPNLGGFPEFIEATGGGILYEPNDFEHLAQALSLMLDNPDLIRKKGLKGRQVVMERFSMQNMAKNILDVYKKVVN